MDKHPLLKQPKEENLLAMAGKFDFHQSNKEKHYI